MTSAERALRLVRERRFHKLDMDAVRALAKHADAANLSVGDLDGAAWLSRVIDAAIAEALAARWVPVGERLPEVYPHYGEDVLLCLANGSRRVGWRAINCDDEEGWIGPGDEEILDVVAWQPLPAPWVAL